MTKLQVAFAYDENGTYLGETYVQEFEGHPGEFNMIPGCTLEEPPALGQDEIAKWDGKSWNVKKVPKVEEPEVVPENPLRLEEAELLSYLTSTDWYAIRLAETGEEPPLDVSDKRQYARNRISEIREQLKEVASGLADDGA